MDNKLELYRLSIISKINKIREEYGMMFGVDKFSYFKNVNNLLMGLNTCPDANLFMG